MGEDHWSDKGKNTKIFNDQTAKDAELEKNKTLFRDALETPAPALELNPPWAGEADAAADRERRNQEVQAAIASREAQKEPLIKDDQTQEHQRQDDDKQKQIQRDSDIADTKTRQAEVEVERKRLSREEIEQQQSDAQRQAIIKNHAEKERQQAEARLKDRQQGDELERNRELFRQAATRSQGIERDID